MTSEVFTRQRVWPEEAFDVPIMARARFTISQVITLNSSCPNDLNIACCVAGSQGGSHTSQHGNAVDDKHRRMKANLRRITPIQCAVPSISFKLLAIGTPSVRYEISFVNSTHRLYYLNHCSVIFAVVMLNAMYCFTGPCYNETQL